MVENSTISGSGSHSIYAHPNALRYVQSNQLESVLLAGGAVDTSAVWHQDPSAPYPYILTSSVLVEDGVTLTIEPGTDVQIDDPTAYLRVAGTLIADGTPPESIIASDPSVERLTALAPSGIRTTQSNSEAAASADVLVLAVKPQMLREVCNSRSDIEVRPFSGLLVDFAEEIGASVLVRGLRAAADFDYEFEMGLMNRELSPRIETVFFLTRPQYMFVSSKLIKEIAQKGGDVAPFVPPAVQDAIIAKLGRSTPGA